MESSKENSPPRNDEEGDSDVEIEGMDMEEDEDDAVASEPPQDTEEEKVVSNAAEHEAEEGSNLASEDEHELEAARKERMELMAEERKKTIPEQSKAASVEEQLEYLLAQSEVFAHFLAGMYAVHCLLRPYRMDASYAIFI